MMPPDPDADHGHHHLRVSVRPGATIGDDHTVGSFDMTALFNGMEPALREFSPEAVNQLAVNALAMLAFGFGALDAARSNDPDLRRPAFYVAAAAALTEVTPGTTTHSKRSRSRLCMCMYEL